MQKPRKSIFRGSHREVLCKEDGCEYLVKTLKIICEELFFAKVTGWRPQN